MTVEPLVEYVDVLGTRLHYCEMGTGDPVVFIHGMPTSSYLWRHILPKMQGQARCIALDLVGMGQSGKPDIPYRIFDHIEYFDAFMAALGLDKQPVTLVMHGWGSVIACDYARRHPDQIKSLVFYESHLRPVTSYDMLSLPVQQFASMLRNEKASYKAIVEQDYFIDKLLPSGSVDPLPQAVIAHYRAAFPTPESRRVLWQYVKDLPLGQGPSDVVALISQYSSWLQASVVPKLLMYAVPGFITTMDTVAWASEHMPNLTLEDLGTAMHFAQETMPETFAETLSHWYGTL